MSKKKYYKIPIRVHPAVYRFIDNNYNSVSGAYDFRKENLYYFVSGCIQQSNIKNKSRISVKFSDYVLIYIHITEYDFYHFGYQMSEFQQFRFSKFVLALIIEKGCDKIMLAHTIAGVPRDVAIREFLLENLFEENEFNYAQFRKLYQRKWINKEKEISEFLENIKESSINKSQIKDKMSIKKNVQIVPIFKIQ